jgi:hypothetical protein
VDLHALSPPYVFVNDFKFVFLLNGHIEGTINVSLVLKVTKVIPKTDI